MRATKACGSGYVSLSEGAAMVLARDRRASRSSAGPRPFHQLLLGPGQPLQDLAAGLPVPVPTVSLRVRVEMLVAISSSAPCTTTTASQWLLSRLVLVHVY